MDIKSQCATTFEAATSARSALGTAVWMTRSCSAMCGAVQLSDIVELARNVNADVDDGHVYMNTSVLTVAGATRGCLGGAKTGAAGGHGNAVGHEFSILRLLQSTQD